MNEFLDDTTSWGIVQKPTPSRPGGETLMRTIALALAAVAMLSTPAFAAGTRCRDAKGKFIKCPTPKKTVHCKLANGKFAKCGTPGAKPV